MKKISLVFIAFIFIILSCSKEQNSVVEPELLNSKEQVLKKVEERYSKFGRPKVKRISVEQAIENDSKNEAFLELLSKNNMTLESVYDKNLIARNTCQDLTACYIYDIIFDVNWDNTVDTIDENAVQDVLLGFLTIQQSIALGNLSMDLVGYSDCFIDCQPQPNCEDLTIADLVNLKRWIIGGYISCEE